MLTQIKLVKSRGVVRNYMKGIFEFFGESGTVPESALGRKSFIQIVY